MERLKETLNPEEQQGAIEGPTTYKTATNKYELHCGVCGGLYFVDEATLGEVSAAMDADPSENPFCCDDCEEEYEEDEYAH